MSLRLYKKMYMYLVSVVIDWVKGDLVTEDGGDGQGQEGSDRCKLHDVL